MEGDCVSIRMGLNHTTHTHTHTVVYISLQEGKENNLLREKKNPTRLETVLEKESDEKKKEKKKK